MIYLKQNDEFNSREKAFVVLVLEDFESIPWVGSQPPKLSKEFPIENWFLPLIILTALFARNNLINYYINYFDITRSYAALRAADLDWIVGPGYSLGGYILEKNHENQPGTMKNHEMLPKIMKNHPGSMKTNLKPWKTMKNQSGTIKNHEKPT